MRSAYQGRHKRQYMILPAPAVAARPRFGWRGAHRFMILCVFFAVPESYTTWRWALHHDGFMFGVLSTAYLIMFGIFCVIARPWERYP